MNEIAKKDETALVQTPTPMDMIQMAIQQGTSPEQLGQLMDLQDRWEAKQAKKMFVSALSAFRRDCPNIDKNAEGHNSKYATLSNTVNTIKETMEINGLTHSWTTETDGAAEKTEITVTCIVTHLDGHSAQAGLSAGIDTSGSMSVIQGIGSTVSYLQRYTLFAVLGITSEEMDDDGYGPDQTIDDEQKEFIISEIKETGADTKDFLDFMKVKSVDEIPLLKFNKAKNGLKAFRKKK